MKPIMFESLRNLLKSRPGKSKHKDKGVDASFKRSDSFKRISIRKSYLDRGRNKRLTQQKLSQAAVQQQQQQSVQPAGTSINCGSSESGGVASLIDLDDINKVTTTKQLQLQQKHFVANNSNNNSGGGGGRKNNNKNSGTDDLLLIHHNHHHHHHNPAAVGSSNGNELCDVGVSGGGGNGGNRIGVVDASIEHQQNKCKSTGAIVVGRPKTSLEEITEILSFDKSPRSQRRHSEWYDETAVVARKEVEVQTVRMDFDRLDAMAAKSSSSAGNMRSAAHQSVVVDVITDSAVTAKSVVYDQSNAVRLHPQRLVKSGAVDTQHHLSSREVTVKNGHAATSDDDLDDDNHLQKNGDNLKYVNSLYLTGNETVSSIESSNGQHNDRSLQSLLEDTSIVVKRVGSKGHSSTQTAVEFERISEKDQDDREESFVDSIEQMPSLVTFKTFLQSKEFSAPVAANNTAGSGVPQKPANVSRTQVTYEPINSNTFKISASAKKNKSRGAVKSNKVEGGGGGEGQDVNSSTTTAIGDVSIVIKVPYSESTKAGNRRENGMERQTVAKADEVDDNDENSSDTTDSSTVCDDSEEKDREQTSNYVSTYEINLDYPSYLGNIDEDIISSDGNMPYPLRMKTNPFTHQKELYAVNLGRIWKQLNLGQHDEDFSIDSLKNQSDLPESELAEEVPTPQLVTSSTATGKPFNNESFKSMSSRDSGFSLTTLTKSESLFRRKSHKSKESSSRKGMLPFQQRNTKKPKLAVSRDGYFKRVMVQKNSTKRKKLKQRTKLLQQPHFDANMGGLLLQDFEAFCKEKAFAAAAAAANGSESVGAGTTTATGEEDDDATETSTVASEDSFKKEMRELEAFYEQHLLRLKDYYLKRKEFNDATITDFYNEYKRTYFNRQQQQQRRAGSMLLMRDYTQMQREVEHQLDNMDIYNSPYIMARNETLRRKISLDQQERMLSSGSPSSRFSFPHPDKRKRLTTSTESLANQLSRFTRRGMFSQQSNNSTSAGSTRSQPIPRFLELRPQHGIDDDLKYAELVFQNNSYNAQQQTAVGASYDGPTMPPIAPIITPPTPFRRGFPYDDIETRKLSRKDRNFFFKNIKRFMHHDSPASPFLSGSQLTSKLSYIDDPFVSLLSEQEGSNKHEILLSSVFPSVHDDDLTGCELDDDALEVAHRRHEQRQHCGGGGRNRRRDGNAYANGDPKKKTTATTDCDSIHTIDANSCDFCFNFKHFCDISDKDDDAQTGTGERATRKNDGNGGSSTLDFASTISNCNCNFLMRSKRKKKKKGQKVIVEAGDVGVDGGRGDGEGENDDDDDEDEVFGPAEWFDYDGRAPMHFDVVGGNGDLKSVDDCFEAAATEGGKAKVKRRRSKKKLKKRKSTVRRIGDITQKGFEKKRARLLQPYLDAANSKQGGGGGGGGSSGGGGHKAEVKYVNNQQSHSYYNLKNQHLVEDNHPPPLPEINGSEICVTNDGYSYVDEIHTTTTKSSRSRVAQHQKSTTPSGSKGADGGGVGSGFYHHYYQNHRARRTRITQNEKRYHSEAELLSNAIDEAMARFSFGPTETSPNYRGCQPYQSRAPPPTTTAGGYRGAPLPLPVEPHRTPQSVGSIEPQQIIAQILAGNKTRPVGGGGESSSNNSSSSRTGIRSRDINNEHCDMTTTTTTTMTTLPSEYENVRAPMQLPREECMPPPVNNNNQPVSAPSGRQGGPRRRGLGRQESRYTSEVRQEAVQQALAALKNRPKPSLPMPSKRSSVLNRSPDRGGGGGDEDDDDDSDMSSEDGSALDDRISTPDREYNNIPHNRDRDSSREHSGKRSGDHRRPQQNLPTSHPTKGQQGHGQQPSDTSSAGSPTQQRGKYNYDQTDISDFQIRAQVAPDVTQFNNTRRGADRVTRYVNVTNNEPGDSGTAGRWKVSAKIQQLLNTLKRPKRRPLPEFYEDNDIELEIAANPKDPNAPKPEGGIMTPVQGEQLAVMSGMSRTLESALQRFGTNSFKSPMATVMDPNMKMSTTLTYGKLLSRAMKIAYALSTKIFSKGTENVTLKAGDRVALVYPNSDPLSFITAWYGCMFKGLVPLPIELPLSSSDTPPQQVGFLLSSCGVQVALTSESCLKGLPKSSTGEIAKLKGWPRLHWFVTEHLPKPPKDFQINPGRISEDAPAYIEYTSDKEGSVMGVTVTRQAMINHCRALTMACHYTEGETVVCVLDFKREVGLWHSVLTAVLNGMHVLFIPYALMKLRPSSWMQLITKHRASCCFVKSRDLHWGLLATKDHKDISLASLRMLLVADGANPWSLSSCDQFLSVFQTKGLRPDAICPCASSSEAMTVSLRRPGRAQPGYNQTSTTGRGVLSMAALSHGVVRVDSEDSLTSLTLQDCGQVMPATSMVVVRSEGPPVLCKTDQVGEICLSIGATGTTYYDLDGMSNATFKVAPVADDTEGAPPINEELYVRSGLLGFLGPGGLVFVCGSRDGLMTVTGRKHNADDIIATVLAVEPMRFIYRGRIAVFSIKVLRDERVCVIAEQRPDCSEEESFQWMSRVLQAVDSIHQVGIYCLALVPPNHLPKTPLGGIHLCEARRRFLEGSLHPANVLMCPHTCVTNLPKPRDMMQGVLPPPPQAQTTIGSSSGSVTDTSVGPASVMVGNLVQGNRLAMAQGRDIGLADDHDRKHQLITGILRWRANASPDHVIYTLLNSKGAVARTLTCSELHKRAEKIAALLQERGKLNPGDQVALIFPPGIDLICAFYGCLYLGVIPITIRPPHPQNLITTLPTVRMIVDVSKSVVVLSIQGIIKLLKSREAAASVDPKSWPPIIDIEDNPKRKLAGIANVTLDSTAYLDFSVSTCGRLSGVVISHRSLSALCASLKLACELYPSRHVALCLDPYCGLGFAMWTILSVFSGHHSILIAPYEVEANPSLWLSTLSQYRVRDTFCSYGVIELCTKALSNSIQALKQRNVNLACLRTCVVVAEERPRVQLTQQFCKLFQALGLNTRCVSTSFGCRVNPAICVQGASSAESAQVYVDMRALRNNRVALVERGAPNSLCLIESGKLLPGVKVIIANPETKGQCGDSHLGEIWVQAPHNADGYFTIYGDETDYNDHFTAKLVTGSTTECYARTGYLGFLRRTECSQVTTVLDDTTPSIGGRDDTDTESVHSGQSQTLPSGGGSIVGGPTTTGTGEQELHDAVYVVGALDEVITLRGMNYHPIDIENAVLRCHKKIAECAVFTWTNLLVVVVELDGNESEALDLVPLVTNTVLECNQLIVGVVVVVDPGVVPINSRGEKQRMHLRDGFLADQLDPIYVAYNM